MLSMQVERVVLFMWREFERITVCVKIHTVYGKNSRFVEDH